MNENLISAVFDNHSEAEAAAREVFDCSRLGGGFGELRAFDFEPIACRGRVGEALRRSGQRSSRHIVSRSVIVHRDVHVGI